VEGLFANLVAGFGIALTPSNLLFCLLGCLVGSLIGVLPGIGPIATISILLPFTFGLSPIGSMIMLAGIYYGAQYGGSTTAILVRMPGEASSIVTVLDGNAMARQGRAGAALALAALSSFVAGCMATLLVGAFAAPLGQKTTSRCSCWASSSPSCSRADRCSRPSSPCSWA
jgi:putative tricarboxylic transport membrane protein